MENIKKSIKESYDNNARLRDREEIVPWKIKQLDKFLTYADKEGAKHILDVGAGAGHSARYLKNHNMDVTCIDLSSEMVKTCKNKGLPAFEMDFYNLDFGENKFDAAWALNTMLHVPKKDIDIVLTNIKRVIKINKVVIIAPVYGKMIFIVQRDFFLFMKIRIF